MYHKFFSSHCCSGPAWSLLHLCSSGELTVIVWLLAISCAVTAVSDEPPASSQSSISTCPCIHRPPGRCSDAASCGITRARGPSCLSSTCQAGIAGRLKCLLHVCGYVIVNAGHTSRLALTWLAGPDLCVPCSCVSSAGTARCGRPAIATGSCKENSARCLAEIQSEFRLDGVRAVL